jgi:hypothetical protein
LAPPLFNSAVQTGEMASKAHSHLPSIWLGGDLVRKPMRQKVVIAPTERCGLAGDKGEVADAKIPSLNSDTGPLAGKTQKKVTTSWCA